MRPNLTAKFDPLFGIIEWMWSWVEGRSENGRNIHSVPNEGTGVRKLGGVQSIEVLEAVHFGE